MISVSQFDRDGRLQTGVHDEVAEVEYLLRRSDDETVAAIRATDERASDSHKVLASHYGEKSRALLAKIDQRGNAPGA